MKSNNDSLDSTLDRYVGRAGEPPAGQVASSVEAVWERLRPEAEYAVLPARRIASRRSPFTLAAAVAVVTVAIGLYVMLPVREPATIETATEAGPAAAQTALVKSNDADAGPSPFGAAWVQGRVLALDARGDSSHRTTIPAASLAFEIALRKIVPPPVPSAGGPWTVTNGRFKADRGWLRAMVGWAYEVLPAQVKGGPDWIDRERFDIDATADSPAAEPSQIRSTLQTLLMARFKLAVHRETGHGQAYKLVVGQNGLKLQDANGGQKNTITRTAPGQITFTENSNLRGLIDVLSNLLGVPVLDETGIRGSYNFSLSFRDPRDPRPRQADSPPELIDAVQDQLGLRLDAVEGPVDVIVIDRIERPSEN
jgi:uncharacterized protein (TIGR03435 family)